MRQKSMNSQQSAIAILGIILSVLVGADVSGGAKAQSGAAAPTMAASGSKTAVQQFKNIQVLKDIPADELIPTMQFVAASLGVECEFCHVPGAFEKDDKKGKQTARKMMAMMFTINQENFDGHGEVTCYSCHRGNPSPVGMPPVMSAEVTAGPNHDERAAESQGEQTKIVGGPKPDELFQKYEQAVGGNSAIEKVSSRVMRGTITFGDRNVPIDIYAKAPDRRISFIHTPDGDSVTAFDGREGWLAAPQRPLHEMHGADIDAAAMDADLHFPSHLKEMFDKTEGRGVEKIDDREAYLVSGDRPGKTPLRLYFDVKSGLLVRLIRYAETPLGWLPTQIDYADYREISGVKIPFRWTLARPGGRFTIQLSEVKQNVPVDDAKFAKPPAPEPTRPAK
jgi:photosynthetic reaction center cytochrome c subunit